MSYLGLILYTNVIFLTLLYRLTMEQAGVLGRRQSVEFIKRGGVYGNIYGSHNQNQCLFKIVHLFKLLCFRRLLLLTEHTHIKI